MFIKNALLSVITSPLMVAEEKNGNVVIPQDEMGRDGKINSKSYSQQRGYRTKEVQKHMETVAP